MEKVKQGWERGWTRGKEKKKLRREMKEATISTPGQLMKRNDGR